MVIPLLLLLSLSSIEADGVGSGGRLARPGCQDACGNVSIPFPFGIGPNCFLDAWFEIECSIGSSKPLLSKFHIEVMEITIGWYSYLYERWYELPWLIVRIPSFNTCSGVDDTQQHHSIDLRGGPYNFSTDHNVLVMEGCPGSAALFNQGNEFMAGCGTICNSGNKSVVSANKCHGVLPSEIVDDDNYNNSPLQFYEMGFYWQSASERRNCLAAGLIKSEFVEPGKLLNPYPVLLYWSWVSTDWPDNYTNCWRNYNVTHCSCPDNSVGNPYVLNGCQVAEECKDCHGHCFWEEERSSYGCYKPKVFDFLLSPLAYFGSLYEEFTKSREIEMICRCCDATWNISRHFEVV